MYSDILLLDLWKIVFEYSSPKELYLMNSILKFSDNILIKSHEKYIINKLNSFFEYDICDILYKNNFFISGSYILSMLLDEEYNNKELYSNKYSCKNIIELDYENIYDFHPDIDIFIYDSNIIINDDHILNNEVFKLKNILKFFNLNDIVTNDYDNDCFLIMINILKKHEINYIKNPCFDSSLPYKDYKLLKKIPNISHFAGIYFPPVNKKLYLTSYTKSVISHKFLYKNRIINFIFTNKPVKEYISNNFDLSCCTTNFNGKNLNFVYNNYHDIMNKIGYVNTSITYNEHRITKYLLRGFNISDYLIEIIHYKNNPHKYDIKYLPQKYIPNINNIINEINHIYYDFTFIIIKKTEYNIDNNINKQSYKAYYIYNDNTYTENFNEYKTKINTSIHDILKRLYHECVIWPNKTSV